MSRHEVMSRYMAVYLEGSLTYGDALPTRASLEGCAPESFWCCVEHTAQLQASQDVALAMIKRARDG